MSLYWWINIGSIALPLVYSFRAGFDYYRRWKTIWPAIAILTLCFGLWDIWFTAKGVWGFNAEYHNDILICGMPLEEWFFFVCIPYASIFLHDVLLYFCPKWALKGSTTNVATVTLAILLILLIVFNYHRDYTLVVAVVTLVVLSIAWKFYPRLLSQYYRTFLVILLPFFVVNGLLTGSFITDEIVWYNNSENLGIRLFTIPVEDVIYAFSMILWGLILIQFITQKLNHANLVIASEVPGR